MSCECPSHDELSAYVSGTLAAELADRIADHVETCDDCDAVLTALEAEDDHLLRKLNAPPPDDPFADEVECDRIVAAMEKIGSAPSSCGALAGKQSSVEPLDVDAIGVYRVLEKLGEGGMGAVYKALHTKLNKVVAIKVPPQHRTQDAQAIARFQREMQAVGNLDHPNIVAAYDAGEHDGIHFLVMEYMDGWDLDEVARKHGPLSVAQAVACVLQAATGLAFAHSKEIVHRDIKPSNLLLDREGTIKILDMGLARLTDGALGDVQAPESQRLTESGQIMGTVDFMAPEQAVDTRQADHRADIYSLGCTLYWMLTGERLYPADTMMKRLLAHREAEIPELPAIRADIPASVDGVFRKMVAKMPAARQQSMTEVIDELQAAACDFPGAKDNSGLSSLISSLDHPTSSLAQQHAARIAPTNQTDETSSCTAEPAPPPAPHPLKTVIGAVTGLAVVLVLIGLFKLVVPTRHNLAGTARLPEITSEGDQRTATDAAWSDPVLIELGESKDVIYGRPSISGDGLVLVFESTAAGGSGKLDIWMATRSATDQPFESPVNLGPRVNSPNRDQDPCLSRDGLTLIFSSWRSGGYGTMNLWMSTRPSRDELFDSAKNLGPQVNANDYVRGASLSADGLALFFSSSRAGGQGEEDIWMATRASPEQPFGDPVNLGPQVNSNRRDSSPHISADGLELWFASNRPGSLGERDLWVSTRPSTSEDFGAPHRPDEKFNSPDDEESPTLTADGRWLLFESNRPTIAGQQQLESIWSSRRTPAKKNVTATR